MQFKGHYTRYGQKLGGYVCRASTDVMSVVIKWVSEELQEEGGGE